MSKEKVKSVFTDEDRENIENYVHDGIAECLAGKDFLEAAESLLILMKSRPTTRTGEYLGVLSSMLVEIGVVVSRVEYMLSKSSEILSGDEEK